MARLLFSAGFEAELEEVTSEKVLSHILAAVSLLDEMPRMGSPDVPASLVRRYGFGLRKLVVSPYDVVYTYDEKTDEVRVRGLIPQRAVR